MIRPYLKHHPKIDSNVYIAPTAAVVGMVKIGTGSSIWFGTVLRGDDGPISVGSNTSIQDNACVHDHVKIGNGVTIGHSAVVHACEIEDDVLIGMGAVVLDGAKIGQGAIIAAGSVVRVGTQVPPKTLFAGNPAVMKKELEDKVVESNRDHAMHYVRLAHEYLEQEVLLRS